MVTRDMMAAPDANDEVQVTVSAEEFKNVMSRVAATVTIVTAPGDDGPIGLTVSAFMSVSADPAIVLVCVDKATGSLQPMLDADGFTVNVMGEGTEDDAVRFATRGADKFAGSERYEATTPGSGPVLANALAHFECVTIDRTEVGDHWVIYGEVMESVVTDETTPPLVWLDRGFVKIEA
ncbi:MAG: flavin reductase [Actinobacteria bacterium]|nr:MAG: flavin reductase [Actinomycetota bacterium]